MKVSGTVKDAATGVPLPGAKISLYVIEKLVAVLQSDSEGKFEHKSEAHNIEEILKCKVEKEGYEPREVLKDYKDELTLEIKLVPKKGEKIELTLNLKDEKRNPLKGVKVSLEVDGEEVGVGISDKDGIFKITLSPDFEGKTINYKAELGGFELSTGEVQLKKETSHEITMKKPPTPPPNRKWLKIAAVVAGIAIVILAAMIIDGPKTGSISVDSSPSGASVYLDGYYKGTTPKTITGVSAGSHTIRLSKSGYYDYTTKISVKAGKTSSIRGAKLIEVPKPLPNLKVTDFTTEISGDTIELRYWLKAEGQLNEAFNMGVFITKGTNERWLKRWGLPLSLLDQLESGQTISQGWSFQIPEWGQGTYTISIHADVDNYISESDEDDNYRLCFI